MEKNFLLKLFLWTPRMQFPRPCSKVLPEGLNFFARAPIVMKNFNQIFFLELFLWTRRLQFWKTCREDFAIKAKTFRSTKTGMLKNVQINELNCPKEFFCTSKMGFDKPDEIFLIKSRTFSEQNRTMIKNLSKKPSLYFLRPCKMQFWQPCWKIFARRPKTFRSRSESDNKNFIVSKKYFFLKVILWTLRMLFLQRHRIFFDKRPKVFRSMSKSDKNLGFSKNYCSTKSSHGHVECSFR